MLVELATSGVNDGQGVGDLTVSPDGQAQLHDRQGGVETVTLSPDELAVLVAALDDADFAGAPPEPDIDDVCPDALAYTVIYQRWQVTADTCTVPDAVARVIDELQAILGRFDRSRSAAPSTFTTRTGLRVARRGRRRPSTPSGLRC